MPLLYAFDWLICGFIISILDVSSFGDHVGDWEHVMVRFYNGSPTYIFLSQHSNGVAYPYSSLLSSNGRATVYIAQGDHGHYPIVSFKLIEMHRFFAKHSCSMKARCTYLQRYPYRRDGRRVWLGPFTELPRL